MLILNEKLFFKPFDFNLFNSDRYDLQILLSLLILFTILGLGFTISCVHYMNMGESSISTSLTSVIFIVESLILCLIFFFWCILTTNHMFYAPSLIFGDALFFIDLYSGSILCLMLAATILILVMSKNYILQSQKDTLEFGILLMFTTMFISFFLSALDFMSAFVALEGLSFTLYVLAAMNFSSQASIEAAVKYFCLGGVSSGVLLFGITLVYAIWGSLNFYQIRFFFKHSALTLDNNFSKLCFLVISLILFGFFFKLSSYPCHIWTPDVYEGSPLIITAFFAIVIKSTIFFFFIKLLVFVFYYAAFLYKPLITISALGSLLIGSLGALIQKKIKRFIAYTSINQVGLLLLGLSFNSFNGFWSTVLHLLIYIIMSFGLFACLLGISDNFDQNPLVYLVDFNLIGKYHPILGVYLTIIFFSMAGIPPLSGFFGKYYILLSGVEANSIILVIFSLFLNILSTFYYIRLIKLIWFGSSPITQQIPYYFDKSWIFLIISSFCVIWILSFIFFLPTIIDFSIFLISNAIIC